MRYLLFAILIIIAVIAALLLTALNRTLANPP